MIGSSGSRCQQHPDLTAIQCYLVDVGLLSVWDASTEAKLVNLEVTPSFTQVI